MDSFRAHGGGNCVKRQREDASEHVKYQVDCKDLEHLQPSPRGGPRQLFFYPDGKKWSSCVPGSSFSPGFGLSSIQRAHVIPGPSGARSESPEETKARETSRKVPARLVALTCRRERPVVVSIASSSARCKNLPPPDA
jgi:hypothetical protein